MKKKCIFKCFAQGEWWYVYLMDFREFGVNYRVYKGRKWIRRMTFELKQNAICTAVNAATAGMDWCSFKVALEQ